MALRLIHIAFLFAYIGLNFIVTAFVVQGAFLYFGNKRYTGNEPTDKKPWAEMLLVFAMPFVLLVMFMLTRYIAEEYLITSSSPLYLGIAPYMIILACAIGYSAMRFERRFLVLLLHFVLTILVAWKANLTGMPGISMKTFYIICGIISFSVFMALAFMLKIPKQVRSNTVNSNRQIKKIAAAYLLIIAFSPPLVMALIDTNFFGSDMIPYLPWGGVSYLEYAPDGKHIYYTQDFGTNFNSMMNGESLSNKKLFYARTDLKEKRELPVGLSNFYDRIELSETGKYLLAKGEKLQVFDLKKAEIVKILDVPIASSYGWYRGDSEIWFGLSGESLKTYNLNTGVIKAAIIKNIEGLKISNDKHYGVRIDNLADSKPDDIVLYDFDTGESTKIITSRSYEEEIFDVELSSDGRTIYYAEKQGDNTLTENDPDRKGPIFIKAAQVGAPGLNSKEKVLARFQPSKRFLSSQIDEFYLLDIESGKTKKLLSVQGGLMRYDYSLVTNSIIYTDDGRLPFKTIQVQ